MSSGPGSRRAEATEAFAARCGADERVVARFEYVPDEELQLWMHAADLAVLPYRDLLNSGVFLLAETFGLPIVAPRAGSLSAARDAHVTLFDPDVPGAIVAALVDAVRAVRADPAGQRASALAAARELPPEQMAHAYAAAVAALLNAAG